MIGDLRLLGGSAPALLPDILAINFAPDLSCDRTVEAGILWTIEVETSVLSAAILVDHEVSPAILWLATTIRRNQLLLKRNGSAKWEGVRKTVLLLQAW